MSDAAICRMAEQEDTAQVKALWQQCFDDTPQFVQWYFERYYQAGNTLGIFEQNKLLASAQVIPYQINLCGNTGACGYVVGVDTAPEARNRGYARTLLLECLKLQRQRKQIISLLMPFEGQFYYRYGWPFCYFHQQIKIKPQELRCAAKKWGTVHQADLFDADTISELQRIYEAFTTYYNGAVQRSGRNWQLLLEEAELEQTRCYFIEDAGNVQGYCMWTPMKDDTANETAFIREMAWCSADAKAGLLQFLMEQVPAEQTLWLELPQDDALVYQLAAAKTAVVQYPFLMARIVDVKQYLEWRSYPADMDKTFLMNVRDKFASWNDGSFLVQIKDGKALVTSMNIGADVGIHITIEGLSQLVMGARSVVQLQQQGDLQATQTGMELLRQLWPEQPSLYINEYY